MHNRRTSSVMSLLRSGNPRPRPRRRRGLWASVSGVALPCALSLCLSAQARPSPASPDAAPAAAAPVAPVAPAQPLVVHKFKVEWDQNQSLAAGAKRSTTQPMRLAELPKIEALLKVARELE